MRITTSFWVLTLALGTVACGGSEEAPAEETKVVEESDQAPVSLGLFDETSDIGDVATPGSASFDPGTGVYEITASGENMWADKDAFTYVWTKMSGDVFVSADIEWLGEGVHEHRKAGVVIRESLEPDARYADIVIHGDGLTSLQYRDETGGETRQIVSAVQDASSVRLEKEGDYVFMSVAVDGGEWQRGGGNYRIPFGDEFYVGLAVCSHDNSVTETARFSSVEITPLDLEPVTETGYPAGVDSSLEILEVATGNREVIYTSDDKFEAPNWSRDGEYLLFNGGGYIWKIPAGGGDPVKVNTGPYIRNNNDHGISPDGTQLIISDQSQPDDISRIYLLPIEGADEPREVVSHPTARSYWHAWSPDGEVIAYTAQRPEISDSYNIWAKRLDGGEEWRVTDSDGLDDGADFSPDGEWLYFNSTRTGAMQIWKVRPDGTEPTQVTFDESYRDWFPHPSPDGKWIIMVSFGLDVDLADHPPNRDVFIRMMPADGSEPPHIVTKLHGGQGTINVPSWSPDSTRVAMVSYRLDRPDRP
ncbi:TolB family protein [Parvularcula marina]|uniref:TolB family protein n=1 Tax=Parvularcula marina TaxID=2292771 RepID=UPI0035192CE8